MADPPVAVTVEVPVSDGDGSVEVTVTLTARKVHPDPPYLDSHAVDDEPAAVEQPAPPSAVFGGNGRIQGIRAPAS